MTSWQSLMKSAPIVTSHMPHCTQKGLGHSDAAKRISDAINLHWSAGWDNCVRKWCAFKLSDGTGGMDLYSSKAECVAHQSDPGRMLYVCIVPGGMSICEAEILLKTSRKFYDRGIPLDDKKEVIQRVAGEHRANTLRLLGG